MVKEKLKAGLEKCVDGGRCRFMTYGEFNKEFGLSNHTRSWANRNILDAVAKACKEDQYALDLTFLLYNSQTRYPSVVDGKRSKPPTPAQKIRSRAAAQQIIDKFGPGTPNPY